MSLAKVSTAAESVTVVSTVVADESTIVESVVVESVASPFFSELQAATDKEIAKAKKPNLNIFFIIIFLNVYVVHGLIPVKSKGNPLLEKYF